jgi:branched-chain amino acid transport system ATP-binding protein
MSAPLLEVEDVGKRFGGFVALDAINLTVATGERVGLIGPNGSGKSTLVNCLCGTLRNESGSVRFDGAVMDGLPAHQRTRLGMARSFQLPRPFGSLTVAENVRIPLLYTVNAREGRHLGAGEIEARSAELLGLVGLAEKARRHPRDLSQVEMRKLELARAMAADPKLLIADEAMAGLSHSEIDDLLGAAAHELVALAVDLRDDAAGAGLEDAHDALHERALAVAVGAEQRHRLARCHRERDVLDHADRAVGGVDAAEREATRQDRLARLRDCG